MKALKYIFTGIFFGIVMTKSEAVSWYRIQEMFRFQSFQMYGIIGSAVFCGLITVALMKKLKLKDISGEPIRFVSKQRVWKKYLFGGIIFGLGWALTGACPGPIFVLLGNGYLVMLVVILGALIGTYLFGLLHGRLPE